MRAFTSLLANVLIAVGLLGLGLAGGHWWLERGGWEQRPALDAWMRWVHVPGARDSGQGGAAISGDARGSGDLPAIVTAGAVEAITKLPTNPDGADSDEATIELSMEEEPDGEPSTISAIEIPRLGLRSDVLPAPIIRVPGGTTWDVPAYVAGHGESTAGPGQSGNAVLLGHLTSLNAGSVFKDIHQMRPGDSVHVFGGAREFAYVVTEVRVVPRTDLSVLVPTESATLTLVTCAGNWMPTLQDFSHRLAVRAELAHLAAAP